MREACHIEPGTILFSVVDDDRAIDDAKMYIRQSRTSKHVKLLKHDGFVIVVAKEAFDLEVVHATT